MNRIGRGLLWVAQRFAKPFVRVRFPPLPPLDFSGLTIEQWREKIWSHYIAKANPNEPKKREIKFLLSLLTPRFEAKWRAEFKEAQLKSKVIELQKEISRLKRNS